MNNFYIGYMLKWQYFGHLEINKIYKGFPSDSVINNPPANAGDTGGVGSIPGSGRSPGVGNGNSLQYSCLGNSMDREAWWATVHGMANSWTQLSNFHSLFMYICYIPLHLALLSEKMQKANFFICSQDKKYLIVFWNSLKLIWELCLLK